MSKKRYTRAFVVQCATELASRVGLTHLTMGALARHLRRPRSTVSSHFRSKLALQLEVLNHAVWEFTRDVIRPARQAPLGIPRLRRLFDGWIEWDRRGLYPGGCFFVITAAEFDNRPGRIRDRLRRLHLAWLRLLRSLIRSAIAAGTLPSDTDPDQLLQDLLGIMFALHHAARFVGDPDAERRARVAFAELVGERAAG